MQSVFQEYIFDKVQILLPALEKIFGWSAGPHSLEANLVVGEKLDIGDPWILEQGI